jgi:hypothetical protein
MEKLFCAVTPFHGAPQLAQDGPRDYKAMLQGRMPLEQRISYINNLPRDVNIAWRNGMVLTLPRTCDLNSQALVVRVEWIFNGKMVDELERTVSAVTNDSSAELQALREAYLRSPPPPTRALGISYRTCTIVLEYPITLQELEACGFTVYYSELDIVVSVLTQQEMPPHPYSEAGRRAQVVADVPSSEGGAGFSYSIRMVDNKAQWGVRYVNIGGVVYRVTPEQDFQQRDGVYLITARAELDADGKPASKVTFCSLDQAEKDLGLYKTYDEALNFGDMSQARKEQLVNLEHDLLCSRSELQKAKAAHERELVEAAREVAHLESENKRLETKNKTLEHDMTMERQRLKDMYEARSYARKDTSEGLKILPTLLLGIGTMLMGIKAFFFGGPATA